MADIGANVRGVLADLATAEGAAALIQAAPEIDILVNNLGIYESKAFSDVERVHLEEAQPIGVTTA